MTYSAAQKLAQEFHCGANGAKKCGLKSIGVLYGYGDQRELEQAGADFLAKTPADVVAIIRGAV